MSAIDVGISAVYLVAMLGIGAWFGRRQESPAEYFVGGRKMGAGHVGFSIVATDVGGGFSIGLGGLGFTMGLSASWLLFTGLVGAWMTAVLLVPRVKPLADAKGWLTYPDFLAERFDEKTRMVAAVVSAVGYAGFVGAQMLAGAKLAAGVFDVDVHIAVWIIAFVAIAYTALGGLEAVIYTDTIQWVIIFVGLVFVALPLGYTEVGGLSGLREALPDSYFSLTHIGIGRWFVWMVTIVPVWLVAMTLYQRIYATRDVATAKKAFYMAGLLEYPLIAFVGTALGMFGRVLFPDVDPEIGLPRVIGEVLPIGARGLVLAAYFSAIMSTADSCLLASVGNLVGDIYQRFRPDATDRRVLGWSRALVCAVGFGSVAVALVLPTVMEIIILFYGFMVSGLLAPTVAALLSDRIPSRAAFVSMLVGGTTSAVLGLWPGAAPLDAPILVAVPLSAIVLWLVTWLDRRPDTAS